MSGNRRILPVVKEELSIGKRRVITGRVLIRKLVHRRRVGVEAELATEDIAVERVPVDRIVSERVPPRQDGDTLILSVVEEVLIKQLRVVEEVRITTRRRVERQVIDTPLLHEEVVVERSRPPASRARRRSGEA